MVTVVPAPAGAADLQAALMGLDDAFDDGQSQAAAFFLGGEKGVEDLIQGLGLNAFPIILRSGFRPPGRGDRGWWTR